MRRTEYKYQVGEVVNETLKIESQIRLKTNKRKKNGGYYTVKGYVVKSLTYPTAPPYKVREGSIQLGKGCAYTTGKRIFDGNSLWSIKRIRPLIIDIEQAKSIAPKSHKKIKCRCEFCDREKMMRACDLVQKSVTCEFCNRGTSYPELFFMAYLEIKNLKYDYQIRFEDSKRRIDFFVESIGLVETHGKQHYKKDDYWYKTSSNSDNIKRQYAKENNITYIELDCRESTFDYIQKSINDCEYLPNIKSNEKEKILKAIEDNKRYPIKEMVELYKSGMGTIELAKKYKVGSPTTIANILRKHGIDLKVGGKKHNNSAKKFKVKCITTNEIYDSMTKASNVVGTHRNCIKIACEDNTKSAGKHPITGEKLYWEYVDK